MSLRFFSSLTNRSGRKQTVTSTPAERAFLLRTLAGLYRLPLKVQDAQALLDDSDTIEKLLARLPEIGLDSCSVDLGLVQGEQLRRGPVVCFLPATLVPSSTPSQTPVQSGDWPAAAHVLAVVLSISDDAVTVAIAGASVTHALPVEAFRGSVIGQGYQVYKDEEKKSSFAEKFGWSWFSKAFFSNKSALRDALIASLLIQLIALAFPLATQAIVDKVITNQALNTLAVLGVGIVIMAIFSGAFTWLRQRLLLSLANSVDSVLAQRVMEHLLRLPLPFFEKRATGTIINRVHGIERVREFFAGAFLLAVLELPFMLIFLALMVSYSVKLSGIVLAFLAVMTVMSFMVGPRLRERVGKQAQLGAKLQGFMTEHIAAAETLKSLQLEHHAGRRFAEINQGYLAATLKTRQLGNTYGTAMQVLEQLMNVSVLCFGAYLAMTSDSGLTIGMLVAFQMFAQRVSQPILKLANYWQELQQVRVSVGMLGDLMHEPVEAYSPMASSMSTAKGRLTIESLGFRYERNRPPLYSGFNLVVEPGEVALVTGPSGSGKSTLSKVLQGLYSWYEGTVRIDGRDIRTMSANELRSHFGVVPQEAVLFHGTILENLLNGVAGAGFEQAVQAAKLAGIHEVLENLPNGYQTVIGERGVGLSGGQKQRVAIARALMKRPKILIFDESTSGLDEASAERIAETVNSLRGKMSMLFIAHKIPTNLVPDRHVRLGTSTDSVAVS